MAEIENGNAAAAPAVPPNEVRCKGVRKRRWGRYGAEITKPGQKASIWLGTFDTEKKAAQAYDTAAKRLKGPGAVLNFPDDNNIQKEEDVPDERNPRSDVSDDGDKNNSSDIASSSKAGDIASSSKAGDIASTSKAGGGALMRIQEPNQKPHQVPRFPADITSSSKAGGDVLRILEPNPNPQVPRFPAVNVGDAPFQPTDRYKYYVELLTRAGVLFPNPANLQKATVDFLSSFGSDGGSSESMVQDQPPNTGAELNLELSLAQAGNI